MFHKFTKRINFLTLLAAALLIPAVGIEARADTITVSGTAVIRNATFGSTGVNLTADLTGPNFFGQVSGTNGFFAIAGCSRSGFALPCASGDLDSRISGLDLSGTFGINGVTYRPGINNGLALIFNSASFTIPAEFADASGVVVTAPFTFSGNITALSPVGGGTVFNMVDLTGEGAATLFLVRAPFFDFFGNPRFGLILDSLTYTFGQAPAQVSITATPEPATLVLLVTGVAGLVGAARKRRKAARD